MNGDTETYTVVCADCGRTIGHASTRQGVWGAFMSHTCRPDLIKPERLAADERKPEWTREYL